MSETTILRTSAIVRNATVSPPQHGPVKTGALPIVQVRMAPGGPQIQKGQQQAVEILPPRDAASAVAIGGLPMVQVKMTQNGPQIDDGRDNPVLVRDAKHPSVASGHLPMVQVKMDGGKPQVQTYGRVQGGPPQIQAPPPALSAPRGAAPQRYVVPAPTRQLAPQQQPVAAVPTVVLPTVPEMSTDQLMFCRHAAGKSLAELHAAAAAAVASATSATAEPGATAETAETAAPASAEPPAKSDLVKLAEATLYTLDEMLVATAVRAAAAEEAAAAAIAAASAPVVPPAPVTHAFAATNSIAPAPSASYVAGRVGRPQGFTMGARTQRHAGMAPRRVMRPGVPLPMVQVKMDGGKAIVQNRDVVDQVREMVASGGLPADMPTDLPVAEAPAQG